MKTDIKTTTIVKTTVTIIVGYFTDFFDFLRKNNALLHYLIAIETLTDDGGLRMRNLSSNSDPESWLGGSFVWSGAREGREYWSNLDRAWREHLKVEADKAGEADKVIFEGATN